MHLTSRLAQSLDEAAAVGAVLGDDHPLARASRRLGVLREQCLVVAALLVVSVGAMVEGVSGALPVVVSAGVVGAVLACAVATLAACKRERVLDLIVAGRGDLPIGGLERERRRLLDRRHRRALACSVDELRRRAEHPPHGLPSARPLFRVHVVRAVAPELADIASLLRSESPALRGIAITERLLSDGCSPLYGDDAEQLRRELHRIRFLLGS